MANEASPRSEPRPQPGAVRAAGTRPCPSCNTAVSVNATVCPACGEQLATKARRIRCRQCHRSAPANLVICPHCGRELHAAPSRLLTWGLPALVALLLMGVLLSRATRGSPVAWTQRQLDRVSGLVGELGNQLHPDITITTVDSEQDNDPLLSQAPPPVTVNQSIALEAPAAAAPLTGTADAPVAPVAVPGDAPADTAIPEPSSTAPPATPADQAAAEVPTATPLAAPTATPAATATPLPTATATETAIPSATPTATNLPATATSTPVASPTVAASNATTSTTLARIPAGRPSPTPTQVLASQATTTTSLLLALPSPTPTDTPAPTPVPTATPASTTYTVRAGDTLFDIARDNDLTVEDLLAANGLSADDAFTIQPGDELIIPGDTPVATATATAPTATPPPQGVAYTVAPGDTLIAIALRNSLTIEDLLAANDMTINEARSLRPGDTLLIPGAAGSLPTSTPVATATRLPAATPVTDSTIRLDTPVLRSPENGTAVSCNAETYLAWLPVSAILPSDLYLIHLGYVKSVAADGSEEIVWVLAQQWASGSTSWPMDNQLCGLAPLDTGRQWRWYVEVAEESGDGLQPVSAPSPIWGFSWQ